MSQERAVSPARGAELAATEPDPAAAAPLLEVENLRVDFHSAGQHVRAVDGLRYTIRRGQTVALIGESGCGKTVSSRALMGLLPRSARVSGSARLEGRELVGLPEKRMRQVRGAEIAMVFQDPTRSLNPTMRVGDQIVEAVRAHREAPRAAARERALELMRLVRLPAAAERFEQYPHQLSGGMRQRVMIAIAIAGEPKLLIADEATTALDVTTQAQIMALLRDLQLRLGMTLIMISHDLGLAATFADEVLVMYAGRAVESAPTRTLFEHVRMPYTKALIDSIPRLSDPPHMVLNVVPGQAPSLAALPPGCPFAPRCPRASDDCREREPPFSLQEPDHAWACWHPFGAQD
ncbi:MAG TPA: ABC transporter ATP-binding protein [Solirubrobacteraceae bacterium]|jgi:oligopeptide/dipeptide ABC transporter ATP-binding protein|nr:ABC transporter ATP-binding protein [Solirubrobacteraceae bacterium]